MASFLQGSLSTPLLLPAGGSTSLSQLLNDEFGSLASTISGAWIASEGASYLAANDLSYWDPAHPSVARWKQSGAYIGEGFDNQRFIPSSGFANVVLEAGNSIVPIAYLTLRLSNTAAGQQEYLEYLIGTVDPSLQTYSSLGHPTASDVVSAAYKFSAAYDSVVNPNDCGNIAMAVAEAAGAPMPVPNGSIVPSENVEGGFWRIAYRGSDPNTVADWSTLTRPGDIIRFDWADPAQPQHTTLVVGDRLSDGSLTVFDNGDWQGGQPTIGVHPAKYTPQTDPRSVTIYRLTTDGLNLIQRTDLSETILGTPLNDELRVGAGDDVVKAAQGNDVIRVGLGSKSIDGGSGVDLASLAVTLSSAMVTTQNGSTVIDAPGYHDLLNNVEWIRFSDALLSASPDSAVRALHPVFRFYDTVTNDHFYTTDPAENDGIQRGLPTFAYEHVPWSTPDKGIATHDVFRFYDTVTKTHFLTDSFSERDSILQTLSTFRYEGSAFQAYNNGGAGQFALERFYNTNTHVHTYAADATEAALIKSGAVGQGWIDEGASFIVHLPTSDMLVL